MNNKLKIFLTGTMRTGGSLLINMLSVHSKLIILNERLHFFRFIYNKYDPLNSNSLKRLLFDLDLRLRYRKNENIDKDFLFKKIFDLGISYSNIHLTLMDYLIKNPNKIWGEYTALAWKNIPNFLSLHSYSKAIHIIRDPRSVLSSWKKLSSIGNFAYLNCIFNWYDSAHYMNNYKNNLSESDYFPVIYEDLMKNPEEETKKIINFLGLSFEKSLIDSNMWADKLNSNKLVSIPRSAHEGNNILGFSMDRTKNWKKNLDDWEILFLEYCLTEEMIKFNYTPVTTLNERTKDINLILKDKVFKNELLHKNYFELKNNKKGSSNYPMDPCDPLSWGTKNDPSKWFRDTTDFKLYSKEKIEAYISNGWK